MGACYTSTKENLISINLPLAFDTEFQATKDQQVAGSVPLLKVSAVDALASMQAISNPELSSITEQIRDKLKNVISAL